MLSPLIPDIRHPKWAIVLKILEIVASPRARKIAGRLKIYDINRKNIIYLQNYETDEIVLPLIDKTLLDEQIQQFAWFNIPIMKNSNNMVTANIAALANLF